MKFGLFLIGIGLFSIILTIILGKINLGEDYNNPSTFLNDLQMKLTGIGGGIICIILGIISILINT